MDFGGPVVDRKPYNTYCKTWTFHVQEIFANFVIFRGFMERPIMDFLGNQPTRCITTI